MNLIERDMLTRCLGPIYEQMLMGDTDGPLHGGREKLAAGDAGERAAGGAGGVPNLPGGGGTGDRCLRLGSVPGSEADSGPV